MTLQTAPLVALCPIPRCDWSLTEHTVPGQNEALTVATAMGVTAEEVLAAWWGQHARTAEAAIERHLTTDHTIVEWVLALKEAQGQAAAARVMLANMANPNLHPQFGPLRILEEMDKIAAEIDTLRRRLDRG